MRSMSNAQNTPEVILVVVAKSGDTRYEIFEPRNGSCRVRVSLLWPDHPDSVDGWHVSNERASFTVTHIRDMIQCGRWIAA